MKRLFSSPNPSEIGRFTRLLDEAGIGYEVRNESIPYPIAIFTPEIWVLADVDFVRASELREVFKELPPLRDLPWVCATCGEESEPQFDVCWKCGTIPGDSAQNPTSQ